MRNHTRRLVLAALLLMVVLLQGSSAPLLFDSSLRFRPSSCHEIVSVLQPVTVAAPEPVD